MSTSFPNIIRNFLPENYIFPEDNTEEYDVKLRQYLNKIARSVNTKDSGLYTNQEIATGQQFLPIFNTGKSTNLTYREVFRKVIDFGALPDDTTKDVAHGITTTQDFSIVKLYGTATDPGASTLNAAIPLPYVNVEPPNFNGVVLDMDETNVSITTTTDDFIDFTRCFIIIEYIAEVQT